nr:CPBP family intramembrane glutamic endopeptidase [uncultured Muribaculum sp.]
MDQQLRISAGKSLALFICWWVLCTLLGSVIIGLVGADDVVRLRWATVLQDLFIFIMPVAMTALIAARNPLRFTGVDRWPCSRAVIWTMAVVVLAIPAMNVIVQWNASLTLPESMSRIEQVLRASEQAANGMVMMLMSGTSVLDLILSILIMGCLTGIAEELFFRGMLQKLLHVQLRNAHIAIWATAVIFSAVHLQFFGFVPRMLIGAFLGYLAWWSGSLWLPAMAHALNNSLVVINQIGRAHV